jgi:hypothetical protein
MIVEIVSEDLTNRLTGTTLLAETYEEQKLLEAIVNAFSTPENELKIIINDMEEIALTVDSMDLDDEFDMDEFESEWYEDYEDEDEI